jgi:nucleotide sugar dehydrogenase
MSDDLSPVAVVGLGRIGLPLTAQYASQGLTVTGCDINADIVAEVAQGHCPYPDEEGLEAALRAAHAAGRLTATTDTREAVSRSKVVVIIVPVGLTPENRADFSALDAAARSVAAGLRPGTLVILETTVPAGTTRNHLGPILETSGLRIGQDILLAYSPERVFVGRILADLRKYPKVVGGVDEPSLKRAAAFYEKALAAPVLRMANCETAEFVKLAETTYRDVNIALANELARAADQHGVDVTEAIAAANSQPFSYIHQPGVGVGGHCIPVYPYFLIEGAEESQLPRAARRINDGMARYAVERLAGALGSLQGKTVLILGLSYRPNIKEAAYSSTLLLARELTAAGARVLVHDPYHSADEISRFGLEAPAAFPPAHTDALVIQAAHDDYLKMDLAAFTGCSVVLDGRNALPKEKVEALGLRYLGIGK